MLYKAWTSVDLGPWAILDPPSLDIKGWLHLDYGGSASFEYFFSILTTGHIFCVTFLI